MSVFSVIILIIGLVIGLPLFFIFLWKVGFKKNYQNEVDRDQKLDEVDKHLELAISYNRKDINLLKSFTFKSGLLYCLACLLFAFIGVLSDLRINFIDTIIFYSIFTIIVWFFIIFGLSIGFYFQKKRFIKYKKIKFGQKSIGFLISYFSRSYLNLIYIDYSDIEYFYFKEDSLFFKKMDENYKYQIRCLTDNDMEIVSNFLSKKRVSKR